VSNVQIDDCQSDSDGLKGEVFSNFVYNKLKHMDPNKVETVPNIYIMIGPPGSGKSTIKRDFNITNYVNIDLDEIKKLLQKCFPNDKSINGFGIINQLKRLARYMLESAMRDKINILFDTTGRMKEFMIDVINSTNASNYEQHIIIISTSRENCLKRAEMRNKIESDREPMTPEMVNGAYDSFMDPVKDKGTLSYYLLANPQLFSNVKELYIFDNNEAIPRIIFKKVRENVETAENYPNFYNMSINNSPPYFRLNDKKGGKKSKKTKKRKNLNKKTNKRR
jgi:predicted kinase